jgi:hypothetical protein
MGANDSGKELKEPPLIVCTSKEGLYPIVSGDELAEYQANLAVDIHRR